MTKDKSTNRKRISVDLPESLVNKLNKVFTKGKKENPKLTVSKVVEQIISEGFKHELPKKDKAALAELYRRQSCQMKDLAVKEIKKNNMEAARSCYLKAAALQINAFALSGNVDEYTTITHLVEIIHLLKQGTGFKHLPTIPGGEKTVKLYQ